MINVKREEDERSGLNGVGKTQYKTANWSSILAMQVGYNPV